MGGEGDSAFHNSVPNTLLIHHKTSSVKLCALWAICYHILITVAEVKICCYTSRRKRKSHYCTNINDVINDIYLWCLYESKTYIEKTFVKDKAGGLTYKLRTKNRPTSFFIVSPLDAKTLIFLSTATPQGKHPVGQS